MENLTATGFLALGARVLAEPDVQKMEMDIIDESTVSSEQMRILCAYM